MARISHILASAVNFMSNVCCRHPSPLFMLQLTIAAHRQGQRGGAPVTLFLNSPQAAAAADVACEAPPPLSQGV